MPITDGIDQALANAGLALLAADVGPPALAVFDGVVPAGTDPLAGYVLVYSYIGRPSDDPDNPLTGRSAVWDQRWILHCVGASAKAARAIAERARTALLDVRPTVAGLACGLIRLENTEPPVKDETIGVPVFDAVAVYRLRATN